MKKLKHITEVCREIYEKEGFSAVCDYVNKYLEGKSPIQMDTAYEFCKACNTEAPAWRHICLCCGQKTEPIAPNFLEELRNQADELIAFGDSHEKAKGRGMMDVINAIRPMPNNLYFELMAIGKNKDLHREEIQIHAGENGNIMIVKTDEGFVIDVYNQDDLVDTMAVWEDDLTPNSDDDEEETN